MEDVGIDAVRHLAGLSSKLTTKSPQYYSPLGFAGDEIAAFDLQHFCVVVESR
jgi:hypothetical protein